MAIFFQAGLEFKAGVPDFASVTKSISVSASYSHTWGKVEKKSVSWAQSFECAAKPGTKVVCEIFVIKVGKYCQFSKEEAHTVHSHPFLSFVVAVNCALYKVKFSLVY